MDTQKEQLQKDKQPNKQEELTAGELQFQNKQLTTVIAQQQLALTQQQELIASLQETIQSLTEEIRELRSRLGKNPRNSSKPPSSEGLRKPKAKGKKPTGRKPGGQKGHKGHFHEKAHPADEVIAHMPAACKGCPHCGECLEKARVKESRSVCDIQIQVLYTDHNQMEVSCPFSGRLLCGEFPPEIRARMQYGEQLKALLTVLNTQGAIGYKKLHDIFSSVFSIPISAGSIVGFVRECAGKIEKSIQTIREAISKSDLIHYDETGQRIEGRTDWVHVACTELYTLLMEAGGRSIASMEQAGILSGFKGQVVHDCFSSYFAFSFDHVLCNAHLIRELQGIIDDDPKQTWAALLQTHILKMKHLRDELIRRGEDCLDPHLLELVMKKYRFYLDLGYLENPLPPEDAKAPKRRGRRKRGKALSLLDRLSKHFGEYTSFLENFSVPFDNNQAERDLRTNKTKGKVAGCFRTKEGAQDYLDIMSYIGTCIKHGLNPHEAVLRAFQGKPYFI